MQGILFDTGVVIQVSGLYVNLLGVLGQEGEFQKHFDAEIQLGTPNRYRGTVTF